MDLRYNILMEQIEQADCAREYKLSAQFGTSMSA